MEKSVVASATALPVLVCQLGRCRASAEKAMAFCALHPSRQARKSRVTLNYNFHGTLGSPERGAVSHRLTEGFRGDKVESSGFMRISSVL